MTKRWHAPVAPAERALMSGQLDRDSIASIDDLKARGDPVIALAAIRAAQVDLGTRVDRRGSAPVPTDAPGMMVIDVGAGLAAAGADGERRSIHRRPYRRVKPVPRRPSMLDRHRAEIDAWLEAVPTLTAVDVLARLKVLHPSHFTDRHLRTTQRMVKAWRADPAKRMIRCGTAALTIAVDGGSIAHPPPPWVHRDLPRDAASDS